jgi:hypothetical protein
MASGRVRNSAQIPRLQQRHCAVEHLPEQVCINGPVRDASVIPLVVPDGLEEPVAEVHVRNSRPVAVGCQQDLMLDPLVDSQVGEALLGLLVSRRATLSNRWFRHSEEGDDQKNPTHYKTSLSAELATRLPYFGFEAL